MKMKYLILSDIENWYIKCHLISLPIFMATMKGHGLLALLEWKECLSEKESLAKSHPKQTNNHH